MRRRAAALRRLGAWASAFAVVGLFVAAVLVISSKLNTDDDGSPERAAPHAKPWELVGRLSPSVYGGPQVSAAEDDLVAHGEAALPALERALEVGLHARRSHARNKSRRWAVIRVLDRIPGERSTDLLVRTLADDADNYAMHNANLRAVEKRDLSTKHLTAMLSNPYPKPVLLALQKIGTAGRDHPLRPAVERIHDPAVARKQLRIRTDYRKAMPRVLWEIRLLSGRVLGKDMLPEIRHHARSLVEDLRSAANDRGPRGRPAGRDIRLELGQIVSALMELRDLGASVQATVRESAKDATSGSEQALLDMARLLVGDAARVDAVAQTLTSSTSASLRELAVITLEQVKNPRSKPALWKALHDPLTREEQNSLPIPGRDPRYYPIRERAARTLIAMGVDEVEVRRRSP